MPAQQALSAGQQAMRGDVAEQLREVALGVPAQVAEDETQRFGELGGTGDMRRGEQRAAVGESAPQRGEALMSELMTRLSDRFFDPLEKNPENISAAEKAALQKLKDALKG